MDILSAALLALGWLSAATALYGRYRALPPFFTGPEVCRLEAGGCQVLFRTPNAALLGGIPNSLLGLLYYPALALGLALGWPPSLLLAAAVFAAALSAALAHILIRDGLQCRVCWLGHFCNAGLLALILRRAL